MYVCAPHYSRRSSLTGCWRGVVYICMYVYVNIQTHQHRCVRRGGLINPRHPARACAACVYCIRRALALALTTDESIYTAVRVGAAQGVLCCCMCTRVC